MPDSPLNRALAVIDEWPVEHVCAAVLVNGEVAATHGDISRVYRLASISKVITGWTCLLALEEGVVTLEDAVGPPGATLRHCLSHAAGFGFDTPTPIMGVGKRRIYSNTGIEAAAAYVAEQSGIGFADYIQEGIFDALAMQHSQLRASAAYGVLSTGHDMCLLIRELMRPTLISSTSAASAITIQFPELGGVIPGLGAYRPNPWGLGVEIRGHKTPHWTGTANSPQTYGHFGGSGTMMWVDPVLDIALIALTNRNFDQWPEQALNAWSSLSDAIIKAHIGITHQA